MPAESAARTRLELRERARDVTRVEGRLRGERSSLPTSSAAIGPAAAIGPSPFGGRVAAIGSPFEGRAAAIGPAPFEGRVAQRGEQLGQAGPHVVDLADLEPPDVDNTFEELARRKRQDPNVDEWVKRIVGGQWLTAGVLVLYDGRLPLRTPAYGSNLPASIRPCGFPGRPSAGHQHCFSVRTAKCLFEGHPSKVKRR
jgi:hypothetical protein